VRKVFQDRDQAAWFGIDEVTRGPVEARQTGALTSGGGENLADHARSAGPGELRQVAEAGIGLT
jgi:hypothetical protein